MDAGDVILQDILSQEMDEAIERHHASVATPATAPDVEKDVKSDKENHSQWALGGNGKYMPVGSTAARLPAGIYEPFATPGMWGLEQMSITSDGIYTLPDMATETVMREVNMFWH